MQLPTIRRGCMESSERAERQEPAIWGLWRRRTSLEKALMVVSCVTMVACVALLEVVATSYYSSSSTPSVLAAAPPQAEESMQQSKPIVMMKKNVKEKPIPSLPAPQKNKDEDLIQPPEPAQAAPSSAKSSRLPMLKSQSPSGEEIEVCSTPECTLAAASILENMDISVDPCGDFFQFACGGWISSNPVPEEESRWSQFEVLQREVSNTVSIILTKPIDAEDPTPINKAKNFYLGCMDESKLEEEGVKPLTDFLDQFGGWPMTIDGWEETAFDWQATVAQGRVQVSSDYLLDVRVYADEKDTSTNTIYIDQTSLGQPRPVLVDPDSYTERIDAYKTYIAATANILATALDQDSSQVATDVEDVFAFEMALAKITTPKEERRIIDRMYNPMTVTELGTLTGSDWLPVLVPMFEASGVTVDGNTRVVVQEQGYMYNLTKLLQATNQRTVSNYLMWRHVMNLGDATTQAMRDASFQYAMVANGVSAQNLRTVTCADITNNYLGIAISTKYVETYFSPQVKEDVSMLVEDLRESFDDLLEVNEWMDNATKPLVVEKAEAITKLVAYPDWFGNNTALETYYTGLVDVDPLKHFANVLTLESWLAVSGLRSFGKPTMRDQWVRPPTEVSAFYKAEYNSITFTAGLLQEPFYRPNTLKALNYGAIGHVIGHEMLHGFDDKGLQNDKDGNAVQWLSNTAVEAFQSRVQCIVDQYDAIQVPELDGILPDPTINGVHTQGENIADNGSIRQALIAYKLYTDRYGEEPRLPGLTEYTPMQLYFLSFSNIWCSSITNEGLVNRILNNKHSPAKYRVLVPLSNMEEFSEIWGCPAGSTMNPEDKCVVW